jgi:ribonuclease R
MLPELISNGLASLQQGQVRYTKSAFIEFDATGSVVGTDIANSAIKVVRRFAYEEVMPIIQNPRQQVPGVTAPDPSTCSTVCSSSP